MFKPIERTDPIFKSEPVNKDAIAFNIMLSILYNKEKYPNPKCFSNNADCAIVCSDDKHPVIVWTSDSFNDYESAWACVSKEFAANNPFKIMSKRSLYDFLTNRGNADSRNVQILGVYKCDKLKDIEYKGRADNITEAEVPLVAGMMSMFGRETGEHPDLTTEECMRDAAQFISNPLNKVWRDPDGKIVAITVIRESEAHGRIGQVLTVPEERGKSYAKMLVHFMTDQIFKMGKQPALFTDFDYEPSNKCYVGVGYDLIGTVANYDVRKNDR